MGDRQGRSGSRYRKGWRWFWLLTGVALAVALLLNRPEAPPATAQTGVSAPRPTPTSIPGLHAEAAVKASADAYANLMVTGISVSPEVALVGEPVAVQVTVRNTGSANPADGSGAPANFFVDLFVSPPVATADDLLYMPGYAPTHSAGVQSFWLPPGTGYTVVFDHTFTESGVYSLYAVVDTIELGLPYGNVHEGGAAGEADNAAGPTLVEVRFPNVLIAKDAADFSRGPASSLALVREAAGSDGGSLTVGDGFLTLGFFEEPPETWGLTDPESPDYNLDELDRRLSGDGQDGPQEWPRLAAKDDLVVSVWQDRRNSQLTNWDIYLSYSTDQGATWLEAPIRVNDDELNAGDQRRPAVAISPDRILDSAGNPLPSSVKDDRILVVWQDSREDVANPTGKYRIMGQWYELIGLTLTPQGSNQVISTDTQTNSLNCDVATGPEGNFYVVWQDDRAGNTDIWLRAHAAGSWRADTPTRVSDDPLRTSQRNPRVAAGRTQVLQDWTTVGCVDGIPVFSIAYVFANPIVVVWEDNRAQDWDVFVSYSIDGARTFAVDHRVNNDDQGNGVDQKQPVVGVAQMWQARELEDRDGVCPTPGATAMVPVPVAAFYSAWQDFRPAEASLGAPKPSIYLSRLEATANDSITLNLGGGDNERAGGADAGIAWQEYPSLACTTYDGALFLDGKARHNAFIAWSEWGSQGPDSSNIYLAVRGDGGPALSTLWRGGVIPVNSGAHATNLEGSSYLRYLQGDPPAAYQVRPALAANLVRTLDYPEIEVWKNQGFLYLAWDDNRAGGYERDVYFARSNMTYFADYDFYPDPLRTDQLDVAKTCRHASGSYISPIYDMGEGGVVWDRIEWHAATPSGTYVTLQTRVSDDPSAMGQWMPKDFPYRSVGVAGMGAPLQGYGIPGLMIVDAEGSERPKSRYIQYRVNMWAWPVGGPVNLTCGSIGDDPAVFEPVANTPVFYSVLLHHEGGTRQLFLPQVAK